MGDGRRKQAGLKIPIGFLLCKGVDLIKDSNKRVKEIKIHCPPSGLVSLKPGKKDNSIFQYRLGTVVGRGYLGASLRKKKSGDLNVGIQDKAANLPFLPNGSSLDITSLGEAVNVS